MSVTGPRKSWRQQLIALISAVALVGGLVSYFAVRADAAHLDQFELDGNTANDTATTPPDWNSIFGYTAGEVVELGLPEDFTDVGFEPDSEFPDTSTFTTGSKDTLDVSAWACTDSNNLGGKFDILNAYGAIYEDPTTHDLYLNFGIERAATEGDGNMGFWFLKDSAADCEKTTKGKAPSFTGTHRDGDIFVVAAFSNGGTDADVTAYRWDGGATGSLDIADPIAQGSLCGPNEHDACGIVNTQPITTGADKPWPSPDKNGGSLDTNAFYEGFVRVTPQAAGSGCYATFVANTRSSTSPTATIMDFSRGSFPRCQAGTELKLASYTIGETTTTANSSSPSITVYKGQSLTLTFSEENKGNFPLEKPTAGRYVVIPNLTQSSACALADVPKSQSDSDNIGDTATANDKLDGGETWQYSCTISVGDTTPTTISAYGHGIDLVTAPPAKKDVTWCTTDEDDNLVEDTTNNPKAAPADAVTCDIRERTVVSLTVLAPSTAMSVSATLELIISETNDGNAPLDKPGDGDFVRTGGSGECNVSFGEVFKSLGGTPETFSTTINVGDTGTPDGEGGFIPATVGNDKLDPGETWKWKCVKTVADTTSYNSTGDPSVTTTGHGITGTQDVTFCSVEGTADQVAKLADNSTNATAACDPHEQRKVTLKIG